LVNRFFDTLTLQKGVPKLLIDFSTALLNILFGLLLISFYHPFFVFFSLILIVILVAIFRITGPGGLKTSLSESKYKYKVVYWLEEMARSLATFKMAGSNDFALNQTDELVSNYLDNRKKHFRILMIQYGNIVGFKTVITLALLLLGSTLVIQNQINIGQFVGAEIVVILVLNSVEKLILSMETIYDVLTAVEKIGAVVDLPLDEDEGLQYDEINEDGGIAVSFDNVCFKYADAQNNTVKNLSLDIHSGEKVCLSGFNGSGKATILQLMTGLYRNYEGQIAHNGIPLRNLSRNSLNKNTGTYSHLSDIFRGNVIENILLGNEELGLPEVIAVAKKVGLAKYIQTLTDGYQTMLLPGGSNVPGSIRTKILVCRALIACPKLLLFEEFFSKLEFTYQKQIAKVLAQETDDSTVVVISNNPVIASYFQRIIILKDGKIVADAPAEEIKQTPYYNEVFLGKIIDA
jgi:ABC-type bacteriocin/lantibiotic exporter with double-glycine peptidase domain